MSVGVGTRLLWGAIGGGIPLIAWRLLAGGWPELSSAWWFWLICGLAALVAFCLCAIPVVVWRYARTLAYAETDQFRLSQPDMWTEVNHVPDSGAVQQMQLEDGTFVSLSVAIATIAILIRPHADSMDGTEAISEIRIEDAERRSGLPRDQRAEEDEVLLLDLRNAIGWPKSVEELHGALARLKTSDPEDGPANFQRR
jgi:hypothetical protein